MDSLYSERATITRIFIGVFIIETLVNFDAGVVPSLLVDIHNTLSLSFISEGLLGSVVYMGIAASSIVAGSVFQRYDCKNVLVLSIFANASATLFFSMAPDSASFILIRIVIGVAKGMCL